MAGKTPNNTPSRTPKPDGVKPKRSKPAAANPRSRPTSKSSSKSSSKPSAKPKSGSSAKPKSAASSGSTSGSASSGKTAAGGAKLSRWLIAWRISWQLGLAGLLVLGVWMVFLDAQVQRQFDGKKWTLPARVYARPLLLYPGRLLPAEQLRAELEWTDYQPGSVAGPGHYQHNGAIWRIHRRQVNFWDGPQPHALIDLTLSNQRIKRLSVNGEEVPLVRLEPQYVGGIFPAHNEDRELVTLDQVPSELLAALVVTEDNGFFEHHGISLRGIARAMVANIQAGGVVQGGSTLTQQLVKNFFLTQERTLTRKVQEALMAILLELHYSKAEILQAYLNEVYLGQAGRRAIHGVGLASRFYFGKPVQELDLAEIATLVGLVKGASFYNPKRHPQRALERRNLILTLMAEQGLISQPRYLQASQQPMQTADSQRVSQREYPAFLELVRKQLREDYRSEDLETEGLNIFTTLDPWIQHALEVSATTQLDRLETRYPALTGKLETAALVTSVDGAEIRAMIGGRQAGYFGFNRALDAHRSIGSLAKPVVYLAALRSGRYHWGTPVDDSPVQVAGQDGQLWQPQNYDGKNHGQVAMVDALSHSYNQATARLGMRVGLEQVARTFHDLGLHSQVPPYPSVLLGSLELSPFEVAGVYQTLAARGFVMPLRAVEAVTTGSGRTLSSYAIQGRQGVSAEQVDWLRYGLEQVVNEGTAKQLLTQFSGPLAGKTGTSDQQRDAWFAGFDNRHLGVVWVGRDDNQPMPLAGSSAALPIWQQTFAQAGVEPLPATGLQPVVVDPQGQILEDGCEGRSLMMPASAIKQTPIPCQSAGKANSRGKKGWLDWLF